MIRKLKNQKGVTLASLAVAVFILLSLTSIMLYGIKDNLKLNKLQQMYNDIDNLRDKISEYYLKYGDIPAKIKYTNVSHIDSISSAADTGDFYVIDLSALDNLTLNYGEDYEHVKTMNADTVLSDDTYTDLYIINETSHNIFYVAGIVSDDKTFYTDDVADVSGVELINALVSIEAGETAPSDKNAIYSDGTDTATIPAGFTVSNINGEKTIANGLVIYDLEGDTINDWETNKELIRETYNQFVWVPVDGTNLKYEKHKYDTETVDDTSGNYEDTGNGKWWTLDYRNWNDWEDNGKDSSSVKKYGGFYIGRYEAGIPENASFYGNEDGAEYTKTTSANTGKDVTTYTPVSKKNYPAWNYISQVNAKTVSETMYNDTYVKSSLIDSYAWDTVTTWMQNSDVNVTNSTSWGNHKNAAFDINGIYALHTLSGGWIPAQNYSKGSHLKTNEEYTETATGITDRNKAKNIYDFAGNMWEWTTETGYHGGTSSTTYVVRRGGYFGGYRACDRFAQHHELYFDISIGFRVAMYIQ